MKVGLRRGKIITVRPEHDHGAPSYRPGRPRTYVYRRAGEPCRVCGTRSAPPSWRAATSSGARPARPDCGDLPSSHLVKGIAGPAHSLRAYPGTMNKFASCAIASAAMAAALGLAGLGGVPEAHALPGPNWCPGDFWDPSWGTNWDWNACHGNVVAPNTTTTDRPSFSDRRRSSVIPVAPGPVAPARVAPAVPAPVALAVRGPAAPVGLVTRADPAVPADMNRVAATVADTAVMDLADLAAWTGGRPGGPAGRVTRRTRRARRSRPGRHDPGGPGEPGGHDPAGPGADTTPAERVSRVDVTRVEPVTGRARPWTPGRSGTGRFRAGCRRSCSRSRARPRTPAEDPVRTRGPVQIGGSPIAGGPSTLAGRWDPATRAAATREQRFGRW